MTSITPNTSSGDEAAEYVLPAKHLLTLPLELLYEITTNLPTISLATLPLVCTTLERVLPQPPLRHLFHAAITHADRLHIFRLLRFHGTPPLIEALTCPLETTWSIIGLAHHNSVTLFTFLAPLIPAGAVAFRVLADAAVKARAEPIIRAVNRHLAIRVRTKVFEYAFNEGDHIGVELYLSTLLEPESARLADSAMEVAVERREVAMLEKLLAAGADVNKVLTGEREYTLLLTLAAGGIRGFTSGEQYLAMLAAVIAAGAEVYRTDRMGKTALMLLAGANPYTSVFRGIFVKEVSISEVRATHLAAVRALIEAGVGLDVVALGGVTALWVAVVTGNEQLCKVLCEEGAETACPMGSAWEAVTGGRGLGKRTPCEQVVWECEMGRRGEGGVWW